MLAFLLFAGI
jgi:hypothetical protein